MARKEIFRCRVGSHLYGLNTPESDEDFLSVFIPSSEDLLGFGNVKVINNSTKSSSEDRRNTKEDTDDNEYALPFFMELLMKNNPNIVETLFVPEEHILVCEPEFQELMDSYSEIISQRVLHTFTGYAFSQKKKLTVKKERYGSLCQSVEFMEEYFQERVNSNYKINEKDAELLNKLLKNL